MNSIVYGCTFRGAYYTPTLRHAIRSWAQTHRYRFYRFRIIRWFIDRLFPKGKSLWIKVGEGDGQSTIGKWEFSSGFPDCMLVLGDTIIAGGYEEHELRVLAKNKKAAIEEA